MVVKFLFVCLLVTGLCSCSLIDNFLKEHPVSVTVSGDTTASANSPTGE